MDINTFLAFRVRSHSTLLYAQLTGLYQYLLCICLGFYPVSGVIVVVQMTLILIYCFPVASHNYRIRKLLPVRVPLKLLDRTRRHEDLPRIPQQIDEQKKVNTRQSCSLLHTLQQINITLRKHQPSFPPILTTGITDERLWEDR